MTEVISVKSGLALDLSKLQKNTQKWNVEVWKEIVKLCCRCAQNLTAACTLTFVHNFNTCWKLAIWMWLTFKTVLLPAETTHGKFALQDFTWKFHFHSLDFFSSLWQMRNKAECVNESLYSGTCNSHLGDSRIYCSRSDTKDQKAVYKTYSDFSEVGLHS